MIPSPSEQSTLELTAALLDCGRSIERLSCAMTVGALLALIGSGILGATEPVLNLTLAASALFGLACLYFSVRVAFDAAIFRQLAVKDGRVDLQGLDEALGELSLLPPNKVGRSVKARIAGSQRLFYRQIYIALLQFFLVFFGAIYTLLN